MQLPTDTDILGPILLTWFDFNLSMDKQVQPL